MSNQTVVDFSESLHALKKALEEKKRPIQAGVLLWVANNPPQYPWRQPGKTPYEVFIGEWWLKEAPPAIVLHIYEPFLQSFITIQALSKAREEALSAFLARFNLEPMAGRIKIVAEDLLKAGRGSLPQDSKALAKASGLGRHSVMAVMNFGYNIPVAVVDANVTRMLCRLFCHALPSRLVAGLVYALGESLLPQTNVQCYNCGLLDLSETVCGERAPLCPRCPVEKVCDHAHSS
ncbi:MAG: hypothetical protein ABIH70_05320 [Chloroflexota bacterium]